MIEQLKSDRVAQVLLGVTMAVACAGCLALGGVAAMLAGENTPPPPVAAEVVPAAADLTATATALPEPATPTSASPATAKAAADDGPLVLFEFEAEGEAVSENFTGPACLKAVFKYEVEASPRTGAASLILRLFKKGNNEQYILLANEVDETPVLSGEKLQPLLGGEYFLAGENTDEPWRVVVECHD